MEPTINGGVPNALTNLFFDPSFFRPDTPTLALGMANLYEKIRAGETGPLRALY